MTQPQTVLANWQFFAPVTIKNLTVTNITGVGPVNKIQNRLTAAEVFFSIIAGTFTNNSPSAGRVAWAEIKVLYKETTYTITASNTANKWIHWKLATPGVFISSATVPTLAEDEFFVGINESGTFVSLWKRVDVDGSTIRAASITGDRIAANTITAGKLSVAQLSAISADMGSITAGTITGGVIIGGTITGTLIRTSASNPRIELTSASLKAFDSGGNVFFELAPSGALQETRIQALRPTLAGTWILAGRTNLGNDISIFTGDGTVLSNRSLVSLVHGAAGTGEVVISTQNTNRLVVKSAGVDVVNGKLTCASPPQFNTASVNGAVAVNLGNVGPTGITGGDPAGWIQMRNSAGTIVFVPAWV